MSAEIIDGFAIAKSVREDVTKQVTDVKRKGIAPCLAVLLVGENPASVSYVRGKANALKECGMIDKSIQLPESTTEEGLLKLIQGLNEDTNVHGLLVQLPLPKHIDENKIIDAIAPEKDVDGFTPINVGNMLIGRDCYLPCTPHGILKLLEYKNITTNGKSVCVLGRSNIVGKPMSVLLSRKKYNATVTMCHTGTKNTNEICKKSDIIIAAVGKPNFVTADMVKEGAVIIDVGVNRIPDASKKNGFRLVGDVDFEAVKEKASFITPVPRGVGPMTIAMLMVNTLDAAKKRL
ncbi:MAG TPA: tetrahydrofolate dehydrogenase/cyclohydrolase catalytic domain-containing protein [Treponemataceae bacterium]|nr:tetrahydrofolate dehydrogenase/cyclohydrolase catalytic domain-containing protein [Treponemataceae bacterium]